MISAQNRVKLICNCYLKHKERKVLNEIPVVFQVNTALKSLFDCTASVNVCFEGTTNCVFL